MLDGANSVDLAFDGGGDAFEIHVWGPNGFDRSQSWSGARSMRLDGLASGEYRWQARARNQFGESSWSGAWSFTIQGCGPVVVGAIAFDRVPTFGHPVAVTVQIKNTCATAFTPQRIGVAGRGSGGDADYADFPLGPAEIGPGQTWTYTASRTFKRSDAFRFYVDYFDGQQWHQFGATPGGPYAEVRVNWPCAARLIITEPVTLSPATPAFGQPATGTFIVKNTCASLPFTPARIGLAGRDAGGTGVDFQMLEGIEVAPGATWTYTTQRAFEASGRYTFWPVYTDNDHWYELPDATGTTPRLTPTFACPDKPVITGSLALDRVPKAGESATATFTLTNPCGSLAFKPQRIFVGGRGPGGEEDVFDFPVREGVSVAANGTFRYSESRVFDRPGRYRLFVVYFDGYWFLPQGVGGAVAELVIDVAPASGTVTPEETATPEATPTEEPTHPAVTPQAGLDASGAPAGGQVTVNGSGFAHGEVTIVLDGTVMLGAASVGPDGTFATAVTIPEDTTPGQHVVSVESPDGTRIDVALDIG